MNKSLYKLLRDQLIAQQLQMMAAPFGSGERLVLQEDTRRLRKRLNSVAKRAYG